MAGDPGLEAHAFACMSLLAHASGRPREAVSAAQVAQSVAPRLVRALGDIAAALQRHRTLPVVRDWFDAYTATTSA
jgi:hypothetical protein